LKKKIKRFAIFFPNERLFLTSEMGWVGVKYKKVVEAFDCQGFLPIGCFQRSQEYFKVGYTMPLPQA
jgi:hypothetical protein